MIRVKLLPRRAPLLRLSISACHLRVVLISQTRPRSFRRRVRLLQNDLSTPSSPSRALIDAAHFPFHCCHGYSLARMTGIKSSPERRGAPFHASLRPVLYTLRFDLLFDGDVKPGGIQGRTAAAAGMRRRFSAEWRSGPATLLCASSQIPSHYLLATDMKLHPSFLLLRGAARTAPTFPLSCARTGIKAEDVRPVHIFEAKKLPD